MSRILPLLPLLSLLLASLAVTLRAEPAEPHAASITSEIIALKRDIQAANTLPGRKQVFIAVWDFDGTLLKGDSSEGLIEDGKPVYAGLAEACISKGFSVQYPAGKDAFAHFWKDYQDMDERVGHWLAYPYVIQMLHGAKASEVEVFAREHFRTTLAPYFFASSESILRGIESEGIRNYVISASPELFVRGANESLGLPLDRFSGIRVDQSPDGRLGTLVQAPVTWAEGKLQRLVQIIATIHAEQPGTQICVLGAFGNSYNTDGPFLEFCANQTLPNGKVAKVCMINGGKEPSRYAGRFTLLNQNAVRGHSCQSRP